MFCTVNIEPKGRNKTNKQINVHLTTSLQVISHQMTIVEVRRYIIKILNK